MINDSIIIFTNESNWNFDPMDISLQSRKRIDDTLDTSDYVKVEHTIRLYNRTLIGVNTFATVLKVK